MGASERKINYSANNLGREPYVTIDGEMIGMTDWVRSVEERLSADHPRGAVDPEPRERHADLSVTIRDGERLLWSGGQYTPAQLERALAWFVSHHLRGAVDPRCAFRALGLYQCDRASGHPGDHVCRVAVARAHDDHETEGDVCRCPVGGGCRIGNQPYPDCPRAGA
jgi:hypothetical protein